MREVDLFVKGGQNLRLHPAISQTSHYRFAVKYPDNGFFAMTCRKDGNSKIDTARVHDDRNLSILRKSPF